MNKIIQGDCLIKLKELEDNSVDSIVTDPPYELGFMGKSWDNTGIANNKDMWAECLRVLKPGGHLLAFSGTRTYHRMASAIEDAGFEVRDMIEWVYGSGFPKSLNIAKMLDKMEGVEHPKNTPISDNGSMSGANYTRNKMDVQSDLAKQWEGWGTALKPSHEPICMARKPLAEKTVAENCLKWGTGGINIDESRVESNEKIEQGREGRSIANSTSYHDGLKPTERTFQNARFPANLIHDNSDEVKECFPETKSQAGIKNLPTSNIYGGNSLLKSKTLGTGEITGFSDSGNASRFFKSIMKDDLCSLCCLPFNIKHDTMSVCNNTNVNSAENSLKTTRATTEYIAPQSATTPDNKKFVQSVKSVANLCDLCGTYIAHVLVGGKPVHQEEEARGQIFIAKHKRQILDNVLASFVELRGKKDTTPTMNDLSLLFGFVFSAIENSTIYSEQESVAEKNPTQKSLLYQAKASKSERNKGCEGLEENIGVGNYMAGAKWINDPRHKDGGYMSAPSKPQTNSHPTVKPIALMEYLIKMVTPKGGIVLDPFAGSGSTLVAAKQNGYQYIGIEMTEEYIPIIEARLNAKTN